MFGVIAYKEGNGEILRFIPLTEAPTGEITASIRQQLSTEIDVPFLVDVASHQMCQYYASHTA